MSACTHPDWFWTSMSGNEAECYDCHAIIDPATGSEVTR